MAHRKAPRWQTVSVVASSFIAGSAVALVAARDIAGPLGAIVYVVSGTAAALAVSYLVEAVIRRMTA